MKYKVQLVKEPETGPGVFEPITIERGVEESDNSFYEWLRSSFPRELAPDTEPYKFDIELYRPPKSFFPLLWWNIRMFIGRLVRRVRPRPQMIFHDCYPVSFEPAVDRSDSVVTVKEFTYSEHAKL
ncbi:MAG: hypothetical protein ABFD77_03880 [Thermotogota bacterium]